MTAPKSDRPSLPNGYIQSHVFRARPEKLIAFDVMKFNTSAARFTFAP